jgi:hypothetical protein
LMGGDLGSMKDVVSGLAQRVIANELPATEATALVAGMRQAISGKVSASRGVFETVQALSEPLGLVQTAAGALMQESPAKTYVETILKPDALEKMRGEVDRWMNPPEDEEEDPPTDPAS